MTVGNVNLLKYDNLKGGKVLISQIRYNDKGAFSNAKELDNGQVYVDFHANVKGVAPGQSAVFYEGDDVVGGGHIMGSLLK